jgi:NAD(P)H dehydrogenase (quinone)
MTNVAIVFHSGFGHTKALAEAVAEGAREVPGVKTSLIPVADAEAREAELDAADAIIFGSPTYMGGVTADFAKFKDWTSKRWMTRA